MAKLLFLFGTVLLAVSNALTTPVKRQSVQKVTDGGFEAVPNSCLFDNNETCGGWTVRGFATFNEDGAASGLKYATFSGHPSQEMGTLSQRITGLGDGTYTLSYALRLFFSNKDCSLSVTYGSQTIDTVSLPSTGGASTNKYTTRKKTFTPAAGSGALTFRLTCTGRGTFEIDVDDVSVTGSS